MDVMAEIAEALKNNFVQARTHLEEQQDHLLSFFQTCDSPLEQRLLSRLLDYFPGYPCEWQSTRILAAGWGEPHYLGFDVRIFAQRQMPIDLKTLLLGDGVRNYRADFLMCLSRWNHNLGETELLSSLVLEVDGHDYHERTKEQATHDKSRDRLMTAAGYTVFRFTGSELFRHMDSKVEEVAAFFTRKIADVATERGLRFY